MLAQTRYEVLPADHRVHVTVDAVATSYEPNTPEGQVFYSGIDLRRAAGRHQRDRRLRRPADRRGHHRADATTSRCIEVTFGRGVFFQQSYAYTVTFDLVDPGGEGTRDLRIGESLAAFPVWAFGTAEEPGGSVQVDLPAGYSAERAGQPDARRSEGPDGGIVLRADPPDPFELLRLRHGRSARRVHERGLRCRRQRHPHGGPDPRLGGRSGLGGMRVTRLMRRGLPTLQDLIGIDYPGREPRRLVVEEAAVSRLGEYAGIYDPVTAGSESAMTPMPSWRCTRPRISGSTATLFDSSWINEAWAEFYGVEAGRAHRRQAAATFRPDR